MAYMGDAAYTQIIQGLYAMAAGGSFAFRPDNARPSYTATWSRQRALQSRRGYATAAGWRAWAGRHAGTWYSDPSATFTDDADWQPPRREASRHGSPRTYDLQPVRFLTDPRWGWNQSHGEVDHVWGWDPKPGYDHARFAPHIGFTFSKSGAECILWITPAEAFLECIGRHEGARRRTSASLSKGVGQWTVS